jgi:hypothetical protein
VADVLDTISGPWATVAVPAVLFSPIWLGVRGAAAWKDYEKVKRERREAEEQQKRILQEQVGKN